MRKQIPFGGLWNREAETLTPEGRAYSGSNFSTDQGWAQLGPRYAIIGHRPIPDPADICYGFGYGRFTTNETTKLQITGAPTGGTVVLRSPIQGATNSLAIAYNAYPSDAQTGVVPWTSFDDGELSFSGGPWPNEPMYVTYKGRYAGVTESLLTLQTNGLTGGSTPTLAISEFVAGGLQEVYLVVIQPAGSGTCTLYKVTSTDGFATTTWASVGTGLSASEWSFLLFEDKILMVNGTDGMSWFQLGGSWSGASGIPGIQNPVLALSASPSNSESSYDYSGVVADTFVGWGTSPTVLGFAGGFSVRLNAALANSLVTMRIPVSAPPQDWGHEDLIKFEITANQTVIALDPNQFEFTLGDTTGTPVVTTPAFEGTGATNILSPTSVIYTKDFHFGSAARSTRAITKYLYFSFQVVLGTSGQTFYVNMQRRDTWMNDRMATLDMSNGPVQRSIDYSMSYLKTSTLAESKLHAVVRTSVVPSNRSVLGLAPSPDGCRVTITLVGSAQLTTADFINVYRRDRFGLWRFIGQVANVTSGTTTFQDRNMLDELDGYPRYGIMHLPGGYIPSTIGLFKQSPVVGADRKIWFAEVGNPFVYAPDPADKPASESFATSNSNNEDAARTVYMSLDRSESVRTIVGQDAAYFAGQNSSVVMTGGDLPNELSPPRPLPGARGALGSRSAAPLSGGVLEGSQSALWYYAVALGFTGNVEQGSIIEQEYSKDVRTSWTGFVGASGSACAMCVFNEEVWVFNGAKYLRFTRNEKWEAGTLTDSVKAVIANQVNGLVFADSKGQMQRFGALGALLTDNGTEIAWSWTTGKLEGPRSMIQSIECYYQGTPHITVEAWDGLGQTATQRFDLTDGRVMHFPDNKLALLQGWRYRVTAGGVGADIVESLFINWTDLPGGKKS